LIHVIKGWIFNLWVITKENHEPVTKSLITFYHIMLYRVHFAEGGKLTCNFKSIVFIDKYKSDYYNILLATISQISD